MNTNPRRLALCGWMAKLAPDLFQAPRDGKQTYMDAFLFFTEGFCLVEDEFSDFSRLEGTPEGVLFGDVEEDRTSSTDELFEGVWFLDAMTSALRDSFQSIPQDQAWTALFLVRAQTPSDLSHILLCFDVWNAKKAEILASDAPVPLQKEDLSPSDLENFRRMRELYPGQKVRKLMVLPMEELRFVFDPDTWKKITPKHRRALRTIAEEHVDSLQAIADEDWSMLVDIAEEYRDNMRGIAVNRQKCKPHASDDPFDPTFLITEGPASLMNPVTVTLDEEGRLLLY